VSRIVVVEGYDDRDFVGAWLRARGAANDRSARKKKTFSFRVASGFQVDVVWVDSRNKIAGGVEDAVKQGRTAYDLVVGCLDDDRDGDPPATDFPAIENLAARLGSVGSGPLWSVPDLNGRPSGALGAIVWRTAWNGSPGVPAKQTLERLVCAAIVTAHPERAQPVEDFLVATPPTIGPRHKAMFTSFLAKWYTDEGPAQIYDALWRDEAVRTALLERLKPYDAVMQALLA
jgi:hypothetical protein